MSAPCLIIVFAKAPLAGYAKTRLIPALGAQGAADLALRFLNHAVGQALAAGLGEVELCCAPDARHASFSEIARAPGLVLTEQGEGDLGERMARAMQRGLARCDKVLLIGTDAPALDAARLRDAAAALDAHAAVFVPTVDGGYVLVGLRTPGSGALACIFTAMPWSTPQVMQRTREALAREAIGYAEMATIRDIDEPADLAHLPKHWL
jgi:hypothetical protein